MTASDLPAAIVQMVVAGDQGRAARADTAWRTLTRFERRVIREAAVMGYVLGYQSGNLDGRTGKGGPLDDTRRIPGDFDIVRQVLQHCDSTCDRYPYLGAACDGQRRRITRKRMWPGEEAAS